MSRPGWTDCRLKDVAGANLRTMREDESPDLEFRYVDIAAVDSDGTITPSEPMRFGAAPSRARRLLRPGDVLVSTVRTYLRAIAPAPLDCSGLVASTGFAVLSPNASIEGRYLGWLCRSTTVVEATVARSTGVSYPAINPSDLMSIPVKVPPIEEQRRIADHLDGETARIDALIAKRQRQIELLEERSIAASWAMITGSRMPGPRREAGPTWLGTVPLEWPVAAVGTKFEVVLGRMLNADRIEGSDLRPYIRNINVRWDHVDVTDVASMDFPPPDRIRLRLAPGDVVVNEGGAGIGRTAVWQGELDECYFQKSVLRVRPTADALSLWFLECMRVAVSMKVFLVEGNLATIPHVPAEALRAHRFPFPGPDVQGAGLERLAQIRSGDQQVRASLNRQIELLRERRQALITALVTGEATLP